MENENELYWAAGFFDGEGHAGWEIVNHYYDTVYERATLKVGQVKLEPLIRFQSAVEGGKVYGPYTRKGRNDQPYYEWRITKYSEVKRIGELLLTYTCSIKREQIQTVLEKMAIWKERAQVYKDRGKNETISDISSDSGEHVLAG